MQTYNFYISTKTKGAVLFTAQLESVINAFDILSGESGFATDQNGNLYYLANVGGTKTVTNLTSIINGKLDATEKGQANGVATLGNDGKVPSSQLPSYVDDIVNSYIVSGSTALSSGWLTDTQGGKALTPEADKIYVIVESGSAYINRTYRWSGTAYVEVSPSIVIGDVAGTAYDGGKGSANKTTMDNHIANASNPHNVSKEQLGLSNVEDGAKKGEIVSIGANSWTASGTMFTYTYSHTKQPLNISFTDDNGNEIVFGLTRTASSTVVTSCQKINCKMYINY